MQKQRGFTLIELMVVLAIVAVLVTIAAPSFTKIIQANSVATTVNVFMSDLRFARSESIRLGGGVVMCRSNAPEDATPACNSGSGPNSEGWSTGWIIFHDLDGDDAKGAAEPLLRVQAAISSVKSMTESKGSPTGTFRFTATGRLRDVASATDIKVGSSSLFTSDMQRLICVSLGGRARIAGDGSAACGTNSL
jgi:type IV fimbrial biogenesis protein FimT